MIDAKKAYLQTVEYANMNLKHELKKIEDAIFDAIKQGVYGISGDGYLSKEAVKELQKLGYEVKKETCRNESYYSIRWGEGIVNYSRTNGE